MANEVELVGSLWLWRQVVFVWPAVRSCGVVPLEYTPDILNDYEQRVTSKKTVSTA